MSSSKEDSESKMDVTGLEAVVKIDRIAALTAEAVMETGNKKIKTFLSKLKV